MTEEVQDPTPISNVPPAFTADDIGHTDMPEKVIKIHTDDIDLDDSLQVRRFIPDAKKVHELALDIVSRGQLYPVIARKNKGRYNIIDGTTRVRSILYANQERMYSKEDGPLLVSALVVNMSDLEAFTAGAASNMKRYDMSPVDHARVIAVLKEEYGMKSQEVAKVLRRVPSWVTEHEKITKLRPAIQKKIHEGKLAYTAVRDLYGMSEKEQDEYIEDIEKGESRDRVRTKAKAKKREKAQGKSGESEVKNTLTLKELRNVFESLAGIGKEQEEGKECKYSEKVQGIALACIRTMDGKLGERALSNNFDKA